MEKYVTMEINPDGGMVDIFPTEEPEGVVFAIICYDGVIVRVSKVIVERGIPCRGGGFPWLLELANDGKNTITVVQRAGNYDFE